MRFLILLQPWKWPNRLLRRQVRSVPLGLIVVNFAFQRILGINGGQPFPVHFTSRVTGSIKIGRNVHTSLAVSGGCYLQGMNGIEIGDDTIFAPGVKMISANHQEGALAEWQRAAPILIGKSCWIGANAVILPGVRLGDHCVVGAGAVVTKSVPAHVTVAGVPARPIRKEASNNA